MTQQESTPTTAGTGRDWTLRIAELMPELRSDLEDLIRIPSISGADAPDQPLHEAHDLTASLLRDAGVPVVETLALPGTAPIVMGSIPAPDGAPTVLMYSHYDVVPAGDEDAWTSPPFEPTEHDGALVGRGSADSKANVIAHVGAIRAWDGRPPVGLKIVIEGQEEVGSALNTFPPSRPELFDADAMLIADMGSVRPGVPTLTVALRGMAMATISVRTLAGPKHSGQYGGAAPDALIAVLHALCSLHDEHGDVSVSGLRREPWGGASLGDEEFRALAEVRPGLPLMGSGDLGSRIWSGPAITVTGIDVPSVEAALNAVSPYARATLNLRVHPEQDAGEAQAALVHHLAALRPLGLELDVQAGATGNGFATATTGPAYTAARDALAAAWGADVVEVATGGSIPLVNALQAAVPHAEVLLLGATDGHSNIHAPDERVLLSEFEHTVLAEADFLGRFASTAGMRAR